MTITLKDIAKRAGVHPSTVSRILRGTETLQVSEKTRERVLVIAKELNYTPNKLARAFRLKKTCSIGLIIPDISNSFFAGIVKSIETESYNSGYNLMICNTDEDQEKEIKFINDLINRGVDGLIIAPAQDTNEHILKLLNMEFPFVLIDRYFDGLETNAVISDNEDSAFNATVYLAKYGHKRIGFVSGRRKLYTIQKRMAGYRKAVKQLHLDSDEFLVAGDDFTICSGLEAALKMLTAPNPPTAILISGNMISVGVIEAISEIGASVPKDISLIGFTDSLFAPHLATPLTTIAHPLNEMGEKAFDILLRNMKSDQQLPSTKIIVKTKLCERSSVSNPPRH